MNIIENYIDNLNYFFVFAEYIEEKYFDIDNSDNELLIVNSSLNIEASKNKKPGIAGKTNPALWSRCKSEAKSRMGGKHSARAMQLAIKLYKRRGGGFKGPKPSAKTNKMKKWTKQKWMYLSDYKKNKNKADDHNDARSKLTEEDQLKLNLGFLEHYAKMHEFESQDPEDQLVQVAYEAGYEAGYEEGAAGYKPKSKSANYLTDWVKFLAKHFSVDIEKEFKAGREDGAMSNNAYDINLAKGRYLPQAKWESLSESERAATDKKKKMQGRHKQYVANTQKAKIKSKYKYY